MTLFLAEKPRKAPLRSAPLRLARVRSALPLRTVPTSLAPIRMAPNRNADPKLASRRLASVRSALSRSAPLSWQPSSDAFLRFVLRGHFHREIPAVPTSVKVQPAPFSTAAHGSAGVGGGPPPCPPGLQQRVPRSQ